MSLAKLDLQMREGKAKDEGTAWIAFYNHRRFTPEHNRMATSRRQPVRGSMLSKAFLSVARRRQALWTCFATLTKTRLKRGVFTSVVDLQAAINRFVAEHNTQSKPFKWTADPKKIIAAVRREHQTLDSIH